jgi:hypothetical protein
MKWWKVLGVAAFAGVAAGGVLIAKDERRRHGYTPDEIRDRLHARLAEAAVGDTDRDGDGRSAQPLP